MSTDRQLSLDDVRAAQYHCEMNQFRLVLLLQACTASMIVAACHAPPPPAPVSAKAATDNSDSSPVAGYAMAHLDKDGDGHVSLLEMQKAATRKFNDLDQDGSSKIDIARECKPRFASFCKKADLNSDGRIDRAEFIKHAEEDFRQADQDRNAKLSRQELNGVIILRW